MLMHLSIPRHKSGVSFYLIVVDTPFCLMLFYLVWLQLRSALITKQLLSYMLQNFRHSFETH
jgi:hypothetical protein